MRKYHLLFIIHELLSILVFRFVVDMHLDGLCDLKRRMFYTRIRRIPTKTMDAVEFKVFIWEPLLVCLGDGRSVV
jgi:hypothetical protein